MARDGLTLGELPAGARVGTGSPRRAAQLHALGLGLEVVGHPRQRRHPDRARSLRASSTPCVLARAGLARLGRLEEVTEVLDPLQMLPAPGQGALAVECRADDDARPGALAAALDDPAHPGRGRRPSGPCWPTLEAGCSAPVGALAEVVEGEDGEELWVRAVALSPDGALSRPPVRHRRPGRRSRASGPAGRGDARRRRGRSRNRRT